LQWNNLAIQIPFPRCLRRS